MSFLGLLVLRGGEGLLRLLMEVLHDNQTSNPPSGNNRCWSGNLRPRKGSGLEMKLNKVVKELLNKMMVAPKDLTTSETCRRTLMSSRMRQHQENGFLLTF